MPPPLEPSPGGASGSGQAPARSGQRDVAVEGLRAGAALAVLYTHLTAPLAQVDPTYAPSPWFWRIDIAPPAVHIFFLISGYVIGLTNSGAIDRHRVAHYLYRRVVRILPLYLVAVSVAWFVRSGPALTDLVGNFFFLQNNAAGNPFHTHLLHGNTNLWSLHYEAIYYLVFPLLWWWRPRLPWVLGTLGCVGLLGAWVPGFSVWAAWLACGAIFWVIGLAVAWHLPVAADATRGPWPSVLLLTVATWKLQFLNSILLRLGHPIAWVSGVSFDYLDGLPVLLWLFLIVTKRRPSWLWLVETAAWLVPASCLAWRVRQSLPAWEDPLAFNAGLLLLAGAIRAWHAPLGFWRWLAPLGAISYGMYALAAPVQHFLHGQLPQWSGTPGSYAGRVLITLTVTVLLAWIFERQLQPRLARLFSAGPNRKTA